MEIFWKCNYTGYISTAKKLITDLSDDLILKACEEIYFLSRWSGHINGNKPLWKCSVNRSMTKRDVVLRSPPFAVPGFDFQEGGTTGLGGIIELCQDINYNQKQLFCAPETLSAPSCFPLPSVAPSRPFLILCKLYYFHCLFTSLPILYPSA